MQFGQNLRLDEQLLVLVVTHPGYALMAAFAVGAMVGLAVGYRMARKRSLRANMGRYAA